MDPVSALGLAASIIAVIQLTGALMKPATSLLGPSENDEKELKRLLSVITGFQTAYSNLEQYLKSKPGEGQNLANAIELPIQDCKAVLAELELRLANMTFVRKRILGKKWDKGFKRLVKRLEDARQLFDVILQVDQSERLIRISEFMTQKSEDIAGIKEGVQAAGERLEEIHLTAQVNQRKTEIQAAQNQSELLLSIEDYQGKIEDHFSRFERDEQRNLKEKILRWLQTTDPSSNHNRACSSHKPGTGDWFTKSQSYRTWLAKPNSFFWLNGKAGCGKTVLSSTIIENTILHCDENEGCVMAYFYFSFTDSEKQKSSSMLSSLLAQLSSQVDITPNSLVSLHRTYERSTPPIDHLKSCIQTLIDEVPFFNVYLIVDAIDEIPNSDGREEACKVLQELSQNPKAHVLMTSRREHDITEFISECNNITDISIQNPEVDYDIQLYIRQRLKEDKKLNRWAELHSEIEDVLGRKADGMFRWAACQLDTLKKCPSKKRIREALNNLPKTLDETYERILLSIDQDDRDIVLEALRWLCFSTRVLTVAELAEAAVFSAFVEPPPESAPLKVSFDKDNFFADPLDILGLLSGLVICLPDPDSGDTDSEDTDAITVLQDDDGTEQAPESRPKLYTTNSKVLLSHFSIKEYLVSGRLGSLVEHFAIDEVCSHQILATNCLYFILFFQESLEYSKTYDERLSNTEWSLLDYAPTNWVKHVRQTEYESRLVDLILLVLAAPHQIRASFLDFISFYNREEKAKNLSPLYIAAYGGLYFPCKQLIEKGANIDAQGGCFGTALQAASNSGYKSIVKLLIDHGANVNTQGGYFNTALQAASWGGSESIVKLLLDHGANVNAQGGSYGTALQAASAPGHENIVKLLLDHGANVNTQGGYYNTALQAASTGGYESIVKLLLDHGANINARGGSLKSPLIAAVRVEDQRIVRLLLDHGAEVETEVGYYDEEFIGFTYVKKSEIAVAILEHGAAVSDFRGGFKAKEALEKKDFRRFVDIQRENLLEEMKREREEKEIEGVEYETEEDEE